MSDSVVVVTGASSGIGAALAELLATQGHTVVLVARRKEALEAVVGITRLPSELIDDDIDTMMQLNVKSALYGMQEVLPHFKARNAGHVVNVSSMLGRVPFAAIRSAYSGAKHFLNALTAMFRDELSQTHPGIHVSLVSPGVVRTDFGLRALHGGPESRQAPRSQSPEEVAAAIAGVIASRTVDAYTFPGARQIVLEYYASTGQDPLE